MDSPCTVCHLCLCFHGTAVEPQLWHLTADALQCGQEFTPRGQRVVVPLLFEKVRHHLRYLGGADWIPALTVGWKITTNWSVRCKNAAYIIIHDEIKRPDVGEATILRSYSFSQRWTHSPAGQRSQVKPLRSESVQTCLQLWWKMLQAGDTENKVRWNCLTPLLKEKGWTVFYSILAW